MVVLPGVSPPLPIPNRVVKPPMANGTAPKCGRVGSRHILFKTLVLNNEGFFMPLLIPQPARGHNEPESQKGSPESTLYNQIL